jgi:hypothetical protein
MYNARTLYEKYMISLNDWLIPRSSVLLEKPPVTKLLRGFPTFYGTRRIINVFTTAWHWDLSWAKQIVGSHGMLCFMAGTWLSSLWDGTQWRPLPVLATAAKNAASALGVDWIRKLVAFCGRPGPWLLVPWCMSAFTYSLCESYYWIHLLHGTSKLLILYDWQSVSMSWCRARLWDLRPDITSCRYVAVWNLRSCFYGAPSLTRGRVCNLWCNHSMVRVARNP